MAATAQQVIAGLYAAFFNRAPDAEGLSYWQGQATGGNDLSVFNTLAAGFASHPKFTDIYSGMSDQQFVEAIYVNALGYEGDSSGIEYWTGFVSATSRSEMVASFVHSALNVDLNDSQFDSLSASEREAGQNRQDTLTNKADVGIYFAETLGSGSNITNPDDLDNDTAYQRSIDALADIDNLASSVNSGFVLIDEIFESIASSGGFPVDDPTTTDSTTTDSTTTDTTTNDSTVSSASLASLLVAADEAETAVDEYVGSDTALLAELQTTADSALQAVVDTGAIITDFFSGSYTATAGQDIFIADNASVATITNFGLEGADGVFVGNSYTLYEGIFDESGFNLFLEEVSGNTVISLEPYTETQSTDIQITLTGVPLADLTFDNGLISLV